MTAQVQLNKALVLLDRGRVDEGLATLRRAVALGLDEQDRITTTRAQVVLADALIELGRGAEAEPYLRSVLSSPPTDVSDGFDDALDLELSRARQLLARLVVDQ